MIFEHNKSICINGISYSVYTLLSEEDVEDFVAMMGDAGFHYFVVDWLRAGNPSHDQPLYSAT